jgi:hypothetical protein
MTSKNRLLLVSLIVVVILSHELANDQQTFGCFGFLATSNNSRFRKFLRAGTMSSSVITYLLFSQKSAGLITY